MKYLSLFFILVFSIFTSNQLHANTSNPCENYQNRFFTECNGYQYDPITLYFPGTQGAEHEVTFHRMRNANGAVVGAALDFAVDTRTATITNAEFYVDSALEAFRNAFINERFYIYRDCDPTLEICCDDYTCFDIYSNSASSENVTRSSRNRGRIKDYVQTIGAGLAIFDWISDFIGDTAAFREELAEELPRDSIFTLISTQSGGHQVCINKGNVCEVLSGHVSMSEHFSSADLSHQYGPDTNSALDTWLRNWFTNEMGSGTVCTQSMSCDTTELCNIRLQCQ